MITLHKGPFVFDASGWHRGEIKRRECFSLSKPLNALNATYIFIENILRNIAVRIYDFYQFALLYLTFQSFYCNADDVAVSCAQKSLCKVFI